MSLLHKFTPHPTDPTRCLDCHHSAGWHVDRVCWICNQGPPTPAEDPPSPAPEMN